MASLGCEGSQDVNVLAGEALVHEQQLRRQQQTYLIMLPQPSSLSRVCFTSAGCHSPFLSGGGQ